MKFLALLFRMAAALGTAAIFVSSASASAAAAWQPNDDDALILELRSGAFKLGDSLRGYQTPNDGVCVDFGDLIQALDLPVRLDRKSRRATGWVFSESETFTLDRDSSTVQTVNGSAPIGSGAIHDTAEGWCVELTSLSKWFGVTFKPNLSNLSIGIETSRKLPFLQAMERRSRAARLHSTSSTFDLAQLPKADMPYRAWRTPSVDVMLRADWNGQTTTPGAHFQYQMYASGEALGASVEARLASGDGLAPASLRLRAYRVDDEGDMLGPLKAKQVAAGDVETYSGALTGQSAVGRGIFISNRPVEHPSTFAATTLRGELPAGWDAELYRNGQLLAFESDRSDGRYEFDDVALLFGDNLLEVVLYGPQGQVRRNRQNIPVGFDSVPVGKTWYWAGIVQANRDLIGLRQDTTNAQTGWRWGVGVERGIDRRTTLGIEGQSIVFDGSRHNYIEGTLRRAISPMLVELSAAKELGGGMAVKTQAIGKVGRINFQADVLWADGGYESELVTKDARRSYGLRLDSSLNFGKFKVPVQLSARSTLGADGAKVTEVLTRASFTLGRVALTAELANKRTTGGTGPSADDGTSMDALASGRIGKVQLRSELRYRITGGQRGFERADLTAETRIGPLTDVRAEATYAQDGHLGTLELGYVRHFEKFALEATGNFDSHGKVGAGLSLAFSLGPDPVSGGLRMSGDKLAEHGQAAVTVFRDDNGDGIPEPGEEPVSGVTVTAGQASATRKTNAAGKTVVDGLRPDVPAVISVDESTIDDPMLRPKGRGVVVLPRAGVHADVFLPLAPTGEMEGTLLAPDGTPREGATIELVDDHGQVVQQTMTEYDGYFLFDTVPYGSYRVRLSRASAAALKVQADLGKTLKVDRLDTSVKLGMVRLVALPATRVASASP